MKDERVCQKSIYELLIVDYRNKAWIVVLESNYYSTYRDEACDTRTQYQNILVE